MSSSDRSAPRAAYETGDDQTTLVSGGVPAAIWARSTSSKFCWPVPHWIVATSTFACNWVKPVAIWRYGPVVSQPGPWGVSQFSCTLVPAAGAARVAVGADVGAGAVVGGGKG